MKIKMIERPICSGKTNELKLKLHENVHEYDIVILFGHSLNSTNDLYRYAHHFNFKNVDKNIDKLRGIKGKDILVLIDEPFLIDARTQDEIMDFLRRLEPYNEITIFGIGTRVINTTPIFEQFIKKEHTVKDFKF